MAWKEQELWSILAIFDAAKNIEEHVSCIGSKYHQMNVLIQSVKVINNDPHLGTMKRITLFCDNQVYIYSTPVCAKCFLRDYPKKRQYL